LKLFSVSVTSVSYLTGHVLIVAARYGSIVIAECSFNSYSGGTSYLLNVNCSS